MQITLKTAHSSKNPFQFFRYALKYHDDRIKTHNELVQIIDDAAHSVTQLEETVQKKECNHHPAKRCPTRLLDENEEDRAYRQTIPIFEDKDIAAWLSRMKNKLKTNADHHASLLQALPG
jgi:hypothetical protein